MTDGAVVGTRGRVTLSGVAIEAGVSMATVSKVLNGRGGVSEATRLRVEGLLHEHGYNRRRSSQSASLIEVVFHELDTEWGIEVIRGVEHVAKGEGMSVVVTQSGDRHSPDRDWIDGVLRRNPAGVVLVFADLPREAKRQLRIRNIPFVIIDPAGDPAPDVPSVGSANWSGGMQAAQHLIDLGHRDIAIITGPDDMLCSRARLSGFRSAMDAAGLAVPTEYVRSGDFHRESGLRRGGELLDLAHRPTAIFAESDLQALGVYEAARARGIGIPSQLSVVGFDDLPLAGWVGPPMTTVRQPTVKMAEQATRLVLRLRETGESEQPRVDLATSLVVRDSTAAPALAG